MTDPELAAIIAGCRTPAGLGREDRIRLLARFADAVIAGRAPPRDALLFTAGGIAGWLAEGGSLTRDYWRTSAPAGSHRTEAMVWSSICSSRGATTHEIVDTVSPPSLAEEKQ